MSSEDPPEFPNDGPGGPYEPDDAEGAGASGDQPDPSAGLFGVLGEMFSGGFPGAGGMPGLPGGFPGGQPFAGGAGGVAFRERGVRAGATVVCAAVRAGRRDTAFRVLWMREAGGLRSGGAASAAACSLSAAGTGAEAALAVVDVLSAVRPLEKGQRLACPVPMRRSV